MPWFYKKKKQSAAAAVNAKCFFLFSTFLESLSLPLAWTWGQNMFSSTLAKSKVKKKQQLPPSYPLRAGCFGCLTKLLQDAQGKSCSVHVALQLLHWSWQRPQDLEWKKNTHSFAQVQTPDCNSLLDITLNELTSAGLDPKSWFLTNHDEIQALRAHSM